MLHVATAADKEDVFFKERVDFDPNLRWRDGKAVGIAVKLELAVLDACSLEVSIVSSGASQNL
jgi:hypothetical protein